MITYSISLDETSKFLESLKDLPISQIIGSNTGFVIIGFGKLYQISNISYNLNGAYEKTQEVAHYQIKTHSVLRLVDSSDVTRTFEVNSSAGLTALSKVIGGATVKKIELCDNFALTITLNIADSTLIITPEWELIQPYTEEDILSSNGISITKKTRLCRRWSREFPNHRHEWHTF